MTIAKMVNDTASSESGEFEVEYKVNGYTLIMTIEHEIEYRDEIGGSYEKYDFERLSVVDNEIFDVLSHIARHTRLL